MSMGITIDICGTPIYRFNVLRTGGVEGGMCHYKVYDDRGGEAGSPYEDLLGEVAHHYDDGAIALAIASLEKYREHGDNGEGNLQD